MPQEIISQFDRKYNAPIETYRQVADINLRDAIATSIRWEGMLCFVLSTNETYQLINGINNTNWERLTGLADAPDDGNVYGRQNNTWAIVTTGGGLPDAPVDGLTYGRKDAAWVEVTGGGGAAVWGTITGTLSDQTDLQSALNGKLNNAGGTITGNLTVNGVFENEGAAYFKAGGNAIRVWGSGTGANNTGWISFYESNGVTRQGYVGIPSPSSEDFIMNNDNSGQYVGLDGPGGDNGLIFYDGAATKTVWHSGNLRYETGTFTPTVLDFGGGATYSVSQAFGWYSLIGNTLTFNIFINGINTSGTPTGVLQIDGIPYSKANNNSMVQCAIQNSGQTYYYTDAMALVGGGRLEPRYKSSLNDDLPINYLPGKADFTGTGYIEAAGTYEIT